MKKVFRFHVLSLPHTITREDYTACAYTMKVLKFCKMMKKLGHYIIHYGNKESTVECDEKVDLLSVEDLKICYGEYDWKKNFFKHNFNDHCHQKFNKDGIVEVLKRIKEQDFVLPFWGKGAYYIVEAVNKDGRGVVVEPGIGYYDSWCKYRIYESYAILHHTMGFQKTHNPSWYHAVIPNYFDPNDFDFSETKKDYFLFLGRLSFCKGLHVAIQICEKLGVKLIIAGQGNLEDVGYKTIPSNVEHIGYADIQTRKELMKYAKGFFLISDYVEPFGGAAVEAMMSGCPVIVPDYGVFVETVVHGITGYRCRTFEQFCWAAKNIDKIDPYACKKWAIDNYSCDRVSLMYEEFFQQVNNLYRNGWYEKNNDRIELNWLYKEYPRHEVKVIDNIKPKIAIFSENEWAFGRIHNDIINNLSQYYDFDFIDWSNAKGNIDFFNYKWKNYDLIISNSSILFSPIDVGYIKEYPLEFKKKIFPIYHCPAFDVKSFLERFVEDENYVYYGICNDICDNLKKFTNKVYYTPTGVDINVFNLQYDIKCIKTIGYIGKIYNNIDYIDNKRPYMAKNIAMKSNKDIKIIGGKSFTLNEKIYEGIDLLICTSKFEGGPLGIMEAAACGIPVISTNVGRLKELNTIKTFETEEEAVEIIKWLDDPENLQTYKNDVCSEVREKFNFKHLLEKYWKPLIDSRIQCTKTI